MKITYSANSSQRSESLLVSKRISQLDFNNVAYVGLFGFATDKYCLLGVNAAKEKQVKEIEKVLKVKVIKASIDNTSLVGMFCVGNSRGVIVPSIAYESEISSLEKAGLRVYVLESRFTALGNLILANDKGCVISKALKKHKNEIEKFLDVPCKIHMKEKLIGAIGIATNKACVLGKEIEVNGISKALKVGIAFSTANFGSPFLRASVIANSNGMIVGSKTTGVEIAQLSEALLR